MEMGKIKNQELNKEMKRNLMRGNGQMRSTLDFWKDSFNTERIGIRFKNIFGRGLVPRQDPMLKNSFASSKSMVISLVSVLHQSLKTLLLRV